MTTQRYDTIWDAVEDSAEQAENMRLRASLMMALERYVTRNGMSQEQAATLLGVSQPRISNLMRGKISLFSLDMLVNMVAAAGLHVEMKISETA
ncbi:MAG: helix-turn-helix domain-containing protein [Oxalobacteraceae bacterium]